MKRKLLATLVALFTVLLQTILALATTLLFLAACSAPPAAQVQTGQQAHTFERDNCA